MAISASSTVPGLPRWHSADRPGSGPRRRILHRAGGADLDQTGTDHLHLSALPNPWFHFSIAHAIFRAEGLAIGKANFDGLHACSPDLNR
jgi:hypothetical protein